MTQKTVPGLRFIASYSGGKDSVLAIHRAIQSGMILQALIITYNTDRGRSWFHGIEEDILRDISESVGAPVLLIRTSGADYAKNFEAMLREQRALGAEACVFGDIDIEGHLEWCSERCRSAGLIPCFPLWQENRRALAEECIRSCRSAAMRSKMEYPGCRSWTDGSRTACCLRSLRTKESARQS